jgi:tellurite resistance protein
MKKLNNGYYNLRKLKNFPISFLGLALGLIGFTLAWQKAEIVLGLPFAISNYLFYFSLVVLAVIFIIYIVKIIKYPHEVKKEFNHPIKINFYPILAKIFLITSIIYLNINFTISKYIWWAGIIIQSIFAIIVMSAWIKHSKFKIHHMNPAWFIPVVGFLIIPIAGVEHFSLELSWFFFSIGIFWWLILTIIVINRIIFHDPISDRLVPTLFILFAPPIIGFISVTKLIGEINIFGNLLYYFGVFMFILVLFQYKLFTKIKFYLSWWAYSFPLDALIIGTLLMYHSTEFQFFKYTSWIMFIFLNIVIVLLVVKTIIAIKKGQICIEEEE